MKVCYRFSCLGAEINAWISAEYVYIDSVRSSQGTHPLGPACDTGVAVPVL